MLLGAHMSIAGGMPRAVARAVEADCRVLQVFVKNAGRWEGRSLSDEECVEFREAVRQAGLAAVVAHDSYLIFLETPKEEDGDRRNLARLRALAGSVQAKAAADGRVAAGVAS